MTNLAKTDCGVRININALIKCVGVSENFSVPLWPTERSVISAINSIQRNAAEMLCSEIMTKLHHCF